MIQQLVVRYMDTIWATIIHRCANNCNLPSPIRRRSRPQPHREHRVRYSADWVYENHQYWASAARKHLEGLPLVPSHWTIYCGPLLDVRQTDSSIRITNIFSFCFWLSFLFVTLNTNLHESHAHKTHGKLHIVSIHNTHYMKFSSQLNSLCVFVCLFRLDFYILLLSLLNNIYHIRYSLVELETKKTLSTKCIFYPPLAFLYQIRLISMNKKFVFN